MTRVIDDLRRDEMEKFHRVFDVGQDKLKHYSGHIVSNIGLFALHVYLVPGIMFHVIKCSNSIEIYGT